MIFPSTDSVILRNRNVKTMSGGDFEDDWEPLTQAEMKVIQAKQERSNKISKIMGDYLVKGRSFVSLVISSRHLSSF